MMTLAQAHALLPGSEWIGAGDVSIERVHTDTRTLRPGDLFVALRGERFDAHDFLGQARAAGAVAVIAERGVAASGLPGLQVRDALTALQQLAAAWRHRLHLPLIAVTGSNGKTTVTQMVAAILRAWVGSAALATEGNFNNHIGVPLTLLRLRQDDRVWHRVAVLELGMNHPGEIAGLARIAAPTVALVNNAQREHQEFMASVEAVAQENGTVLEALPLAGVAVFPSADPQTGLWRAQAAGRTQWTFGLEGDAGAAPDVAARNIRWVDAAEATQPAHWEARLESPHAAFEIQVAMAGRHNLLNATAAAACALAAGAPAEAVQAGLRSFRAVAGRCEHLSTRLHSQRVELINDSYNANPDSVRAAIEMLAGMTAPRWLVLGDMGEVGDQGPAFHREVGAYAREQGIEFLWCAGTASLDAATAYGETARHFADVPALIADLPRAPTAASVLVKGSRFMAMERVVQALQVSASSGEPRAA